MEATTFHHITVLREETAQALAQQLVLTRESCAAKPIVIVDCTLGGGGHTLRLMELLADLPCVTEDNPALFVGIDQDPSALQAASGRISKFLDKRKNIRTHFWRANFRQLGNFSREIEGVNKATAVLADLGVSSPQLDMLERGFSLQTAGPLDMRMDPNHPLTAEEILLNWSENELTRVFKEMGEEPKARLLARAICTDRVRKQLPVSDTVSFAAYVSRILKYHQSRTHPATRVFQALRIAVNGELEALDSLLEQIPNLIEPAGVIGIISFHSLEDRRVKKAYRAWEKGLPHGTPDPCLDPIHNLLPPTLPWGRETPRGGLVPGEEELRQNPRARSARLRLFCFDQQFAR